MPSEDGLKKKFFSVDCYFGELYGSSSKETNVDFFLCVCVPSVAGGFEGQSF